MTDEQMKELRDIALRAQGKAGVLTLGPNWDDYAGDVFEALPWLLAKLDAAQAVIEAARAQTKYLTDGYASERGFNKDDIDVRQWMDTHEVKIMDALKAYDEVKP